MALNIIGNSHSMEMQRESEAPAELATPWLSRSFALPVNEFTGQSKSKHVYIGGAALMDVKTLWVSWFLALSIGAVAFPQDESKPEVDRKSPSKIADRLEEIEPLVQNAIENKKLPGAVVLIGFQGEIVYERAFGDRQVEPSRIPMATDTVFDLASLTKPIATATSIMLLAERGIIALDDPVAKYLPEFGSQGKQAVTIRQLLLHTGGLIPDNVLSDYRGDSDAILNNLLHLSLNYEPGTQFKYSDVGFQVLGELVRQTTGKDIAEFARQEIFRPLEMNETGFLISPELQQRCAATEQRDGKWMVGQVHDPRAFAMGGIAGHAGLFSTAHDLARYAQMILGKGSWKGTRILGPETVQQMIAPYPVPSGIRGLGWDKRTGFSTNRGKTMSPAAVGHGGFTGTGLWIDPDLDLFVVFLSNRLHPNGKGSVNELIGKIATEASNAAHAELFDLERYARACEHSIYGDEFSVVSRTTKVRSLPKTVVTDAGEWRYIQNGAFKKCTIAGKRTIDGKETGGSTSMAIQLETSIHTYGKESSETRWKLLSVLEDPTEIKGCFNGVLPVTAPYFVRGIRFSELMSDKSFRIQKRDVFVREGRCYLKIVWLSSIRQDEVDYLYSGDVVLDIENQYAIVESTELHGTNLLPPITTITKKIDYIETSGRRVPSQIVIAEQLHQASGKSMERVVPIQFDFSTVDDEEFSPL